MKMKSIESEKDLPVGDKLVAAEVVIVERNMKSVTLHFESGELVAFFPGGYNELHCTTKEKPEQIDKWCVSGVLKSGSTPARLLFDRETDAKDYAEGCMQTGSTIVKVKVAKVDLEHNDGDEIPF